MRPASLWRQLTRGLRALLRPAAADREVSEEIDGYVAEATASYLDQGLSLENAQRAARVELGGRAAVREQVRTSGWEDIISATFGDVRHGLRRLRKSPGFTIVATVTLAVGIGASTAIFSAVNPILFASLPYPRANDIVSVSDITSDGRPVAIAYGNYRELAQRSRSFTALAVFKPWQPSLSGAQSEPERLDGQRIGYEYFHTLSAVPRIGRDFDSTDDRVGGPNVVILSDGLWKRRFGADPTIIGKPISLGGYPYVVVGVMAPSFDNVLASSASIWAPLQYDNSLPRDGREWGHHLSMIGRLRDGVTVDQAHRELQTIARTPAVEFTRMPWANFRNGVSISRLQDSITHAVRPALLAVLGAVLLLLVIACVNVINLLIARGAQRRAEFAMRIALGAGRRRLIRQVLTETILLSMLGGILGMGVAEIGVRTLVAISPAELPRLNAIHIDGSVLLFGFVLTTAIGLIVGVIPALSAFREDPRAGMQRGTQRVTGGRELTRRSLVVGEVSLALVLLVSAGLLLRSLERLFAIAPGFRTSQVLTLQVQASGARFNDNGVVNRYFGDVLDAVRRVPGVRTAGFTSQLPLSGDLDGYGASVDVDQDKRNKQGMLRYAITPGYLESLQIPLIRGRTFSATDDAGAPLVAIVSQSFVENRFKGLDPIGHRVQVGGDDNPWMTIVGVVANVKQQSLLDDQADAVYMPTTQWPYTDRVLSLVVDAQGDALALAARLRSAIWSVDRNIPIVRVATMDHILASTAAERHFTFTLFESFAVVALFLAAIGIFGVMSGSVAERIREIGVRAALGATRGDLVGLVLRQGVALTITGILIGVGGAMLASRALITLLFGVSRLDPLTYVGVVVLLIAVSLIACWIPAWRAAAVDPVTTLRAE